MLTHHALLALVALPLHHAHAYIPAQPSNQTSSPSDSNWIVQLNWLPIGIFSDGINHLLTSDSANRSIYQGVLLHFSELNATTQPPATVPWIAMINCDSNSTTFSAQNDIFTLARDRGAAAAMLYSSTSHSCQVNQDYAQNFEKPLDVFSAGSLQGARLIESQFSNILSAGYWFQSDLLNASASTILQQIKSLGLSNLTTSPASTTSLSTAAPLQTSTSQPDSRSLSSEPTDNQPLNRRSPIDYSSPYNLLHQPLVARSSHPSPDQTIHLKLNLNSSHHPTSVNAGNNPVFLIATLANAQVTGNLDPQRQAGNQNSNFQSNTNGTNNNPNTGLAMIILYAITGCVSFMFLIVIVSGAIRAIRNPDRYGPRPGGRVDPQTGEEDPNAQPRQTRAEGLGKAILDTFPIVKFGRHNNAVNEEDPESVKHNRSATPKELKLVMDENSILHPGQESIIMSERGPPAEQLPSAHPLINTPATTPNTSNNPPNRQSHDGDEAGTVVSETGPYPQLASQVPLLSQSHLSPSSSSSSPTKVIDSKTESTWISNDEQVSDLKHQELAPNLVAKGAVADTDKEGKDVDVTTTIVNNSTTCPICVSEFEEDDDIRMLPCDARHQFHKECVDPWLLNESRFCPLCRWDLSTRKDGSKIETGEIVSSEEVEVEPTSPESHSHAPAPESEGRRMRPSWLMLRNRTSNGHEPAFSLPLPHIRRRQRDSSTLHDQRTSLPLPSSSSSGDNNVPGTGNDVDTSLVQNNQELVDSHNRFLRYIHHIRHLKK